MQNRNAAIALTIASVVLCGCPGLLALFMGALFALISFIPGADIDIGGSNDPQAALMFGLFALCVGLIFVLIPVVVGVVTLRRKAEVPASFNEPIPPAI